MKNWYESTGQHYCIMSEVWKQGIVSTVLCCTVLYSIKIKCGRDIEEINCLGYGTMWSLSAGHLASSPHMMVLYDMMEHLPKLGTIATICATSLPCFKAKELLLVFFSLYALWQLHFDAEGLIISVFFGKSQKPSNINALLLSRAQLCGVYSQIVQKNVWLACEPG